MSHHDSLFLEVARFEIRYVLGNPLLWLTAVATFALFVVGVSCGLELGSEGGLLQNASYAVLRDALMASVTYMVVTSAFVANAVLRDDETGFAPIIRSTRLTKRDYLLGRFAGAFIAAALCIALVPLAIWLGSLMPWTNSAAVGATRFEPYLYAYFVVALPNLFIQCAILFALATITRSMMATYLGVVAFTSGFFALQGAFADRPQLQTAVALADPFGARPLADVVRYWTVAQRNVTLPPLAGTLLYNRLLWVGIAVLCVAFALATYSAADPATPRRARKSRKASEPVRTAAGNDGTSAVLPSPRHDARARWTLLWLRTRFELRQVVLHPAFAVVMAWGAYVTGLVLLTQRDPDGRPTYPTTRSLIPELDNAIGMMLVVVVIYYAGELVWRERDRRVDALIDATPMPNWGYVIPKTVAMGTVLIGVLLASVIASVLLQLSLHFTQLELGKYLWWYMLPRTWDLLTLGALAILVQALSPHKAIGWAVMLMFLVGQELNTVVDSNLVLYGGTPSVPLSDMNGAGSFWHGAWVFRAYWGAVAMLLLVCAHILWRRGVDTRLRSRLARARRRFAGPPAWVAGGALLTVLVAGTDAYYNTVVLNGYRTRSANQEFAAAYERKYGSYANLPQPRITAVKVAVAIYPAERRAVATGSYVLRNESAVTIPDVHVRIVGDGLELTSAEIAGARLVVDDRRYRYRIYHLEHPMRPGETRVMTFRTLRVRRGFQNEPTDTRIVANGTFLNETQLMPVVGLVRAGMLQDPAARREHGLPALPGTPKLEDLAATERTTYGRGWASTDITVSTSADQVPVAPGSKVSDVVHGNRRVARFVSRVPVHPRFSVQSARYAEKHRIHAGVDLAVYYDPAHAWDVDHMLDALAAALDYYQANFGPYPFDYARIVEFPGFHDFAQAFAGTIPYSEDVGFVSDYRAPDTIDYVTYLTAHELAHQYWSQQLVGADMQGREVLSETLAQYSAQMVMRKLRGPDHLRRYLQFELDRYLEGRGGTPNAEPTLARVDGQEYVTYRKGALAMYLLQQRLGEASINRALRALLARYRFRGPPFPRSLDLVAALRHEAHTAEDQTLITDLFERIALYDLRTSTPTAARRPDGRWDVTVPIQAHKFYVTNGADSETRLAEHIEVGLFTAEPGRDAFDARNVLLLEREPIHSGVQLLHFITDRRPTFAGVDPYNFYIDRNAEDNIAPVR